MTAVPLGGPSTGIPPVGVECVETGNSAFMRVSEGEKSISTPVSVHLRMLTRKRPTTPMIAEFPLSG